VRGRHGSGLVISSVVEVGLRWTMRDKRLRGVEGNM
jgi:hypothetical protein